MLAPMNPPARPGQMVQCTVCLRMVDASTVLVDTEGQAFKDYYCRGCQSWAPEHGGPGVRA